MFVTFTSDTEVLELSLELDDDQLRVREIVSIPDPTTTTAPSPPPAPAPAPPAELPAGEAGSVQIIINGANIAIDDIKLKLGWVAQVEQAEGGDVQVMFVRGELRIRFHAVMNDGRIDSAFERVAFKDWDRRFKRFDRDGDGRFGRSGDGDGRRGDRDGDGRWKDHDRKH
ncbi:MAG: hypothetical protein ACRDZ3_06085 [Acidimicrobiia bacterium]